MSFDADEGEVGEATARGDAAWLWSVITGAYAERDAARERIAELEATRDGLVEWRDGTTRDVIEAARFVKLSASEPGAGPVSPAIAALVDALDAYDKASG